MSLPSKKIVAWLEREGFRRLQMPGTWEWTRRVPPRRADPRGPPYQINRSEISVTYHPGFKVSETDSRTGLKYPDHIPSWSLKTEVHADKFMADVETDVLDEITHALVWQDQNLVIWPDEERSSHRDGPGGFDGYGADDIDYTPKSREVLLGDWLLGMGFKELGFEYPAQERRDFAYGTHGGMEVVVSIPRDAFLFGYGVLVWITSHGSSWPTRTEFTFDNAKRAVEEALVELDRRLELPPPRKLVQLSWEPEGECDFPRCERTAYAFTLEGAEGYTVACSQHARQMYEESAR